MSGIKTVYHKGNGLTVHQSVLDEIGLSAGQDITEDQVRKCIELNAAAFVSDMALLRVAGVKVPDTSSLENKLAEIAAGDRPSSIA